MDERTRTPPPVGAGPVTTQHRQAARPQPLPQPAPEPEPEIQAIEAAKSLWPLKVKLGKPIDIKNKADGASVAYIDVLEFREPTAGDLIACGIPVIVLDYATGQTTFDPPKMTAMMARLSKTPPAYFAQMDTVDSVNAATMLQNFFLPSFDRLI